MKCACGADINNIPEHLADLGIYICTKCATIAQRDTAAALRGKKPKFSIAPPRASVEYIIRGEQPFGEE